MKTRFSKKRTATVTLTPRMKQLKKEMENAIKRRAVKEVLDGIESDNGKPSYGSIKATVGRYQEAGYSYITIGVIKHHLYQIKIGNTALSCYGSTVGVPDLIEIVNPNSTSTISPLVDPNTSTSSLSTRKIGGRPPGSTIQLKELLIDAKNKATTKAATEYSKVKAEKLAKGKSCDKGQLKEIISQAEEEFGLFPNTVSIETVKSRVKRNNVTGSTYQKTSPMLSVEPIIVHCKKLAIIGDPLKKEHIIALANDIIRGTSHELKVVEWKKKMNLWKDESDNNVSAKWYSAFMKRNKHELKRSRGRVIDINRKTWCSYLHFESMYESVYESMVEAGVARKVSVPVWLDKDNNIVELESEAFGRKTQYLMTDPDYVLFADETGSNTNQKDDGRRGGELFVVPCSDNESCGLTGATTDIHFTVMCFSSATGNPVLAVVILKSEKHVDDIPLSLKFGIDITKPADRSGTTKAEIFERNCGEDKMLCGGPKCFHNGKEIPCFIGCSPKASITSQMLADILAYMDKIKLFDRSQGISPFLLIDGHHSRMELPFLNYIFDPLHRWFVCIGVPYGTHVWQVADSAQQNSAFKSKLVEAKRELLKHRPLSKERFYGTDIIPLVNAAWNDSFGNVLSSKKAITERGWNPLNYCLLDNPALQKNEMSEMSTSTSNNNQPSVDPDTLQLTEGVPRELLDKIVDHTMMDKARVDGIKKKRATLRDNQTFANDLRDLTRLTSGKIAARGEFALEEKHRNHIRDIIDRDEQEEAKRKEKRDKRTIDMNNKFGTAAAKIARNEVLHVDDYKALIQYYKKPGDSPMRSKVNEVKIQWENRKSRHVVQQLHAPFNDNTGAVDDDNGDNFDGIMAENENYGETTTSFEL
jgi:hypothetical protein